jgi:hypothetical protein
MLYHFYAAIIFTDSAIDNYFKRFVRDFMRYNDKIYCAAGKVVRSLQQEGMAMGFKNDEEGVGSYSSLHVRRGELQFKEVKIPAEEWMTNTKELWRTNELLFIATDEKNKTFFDPIAKYHQVRFLDDYWKEANLADLDPNFLVSANFRIICFLLNAEFPFDLRNFCTLFLCTIIGCREWLILLLQVGGECLLGRCIQLLLVTLTECVGIMG